jgi:hypothetical protein
MATYSQSLKLTLLANGEGAGTWGQTTNTNLGTLLEQAITGVQTITMSNANVTLTSTDGTADQARNAVLVVTGTNAAVRDIIAPLVNKQYLVVNNTTGGFAINIRAASGFSVSIPNGSSVFVYCDGTNFYSAQQNYTTGNFTVGGNLAVTGTSTFTGAVTANSVSLGNLTATGNVTAANFSTAGFANAANVVASGNSQFNGTGALKIPVGTNGQRPSPTTGMVRFSSTDVQFEGYNGTQWTSIGGAAAGGAVYENKQSINANYTMTTDYNGESVGPITIASGVVVTIPSGSRWVIL